MSEKIIKGIIKLPKAISGYWFFEKKEADLDFEKKEITTIVDDEPKTQRFFKVEKFEMFHFLKYIVPLLAILTSDFYSLTLKNGLSLIFAGLTVIVWQKYRELPRENIIHFTTVVTALLFLTAPFTVAGLFSAGLIVIFMKLYFTAWCAIAVYEIALGIASREWERMGKVYIPGLPRFMVYYFTLPETSKSSQNKCLVAAKIKNNVFIGAAIIGGIGLTTLTYTGIVMFKENKIKKEDLAEYTQAENLSKLKTQAENNGSAQVVIKWERIKLSEATEKLHKQLGIDPEYKNIKTITYPWEKGYKQGGTAIYKENSPVVYMLGARGNFVDTEAGPAYAPEFSGGAQQ